MGVGSVFLRVGVVTIGPPQVWQSTAGQWPGDVAPLARLQLAGAAGLPVGRGGRARGGLRRDTAERLAALGFATIERAAPRGGPVAALGRPIRAFAAQLRLSL